MRDARREGYSSRYAQLKRRPRDDITVVTCVHMSAAGDTGYESARFARHASTDAQRQRRRQPYAAQPALFDGYKRETQEGFEAELSRATHVAFP
jgi:hypothetical protein